MTVFDMKGSTIDVAGRYDGGVLSLGIDLPAILEAAAESDA
jgi:hypothetical protein